MPSLTPLFEATLPVQVHVGAAFLAIALLPLTLFRRRKDRVHRISGRLWALALGVTALSSFWITGVRWIGPFSPIHILSLYAIWGLIQGVRAAIQGDFRRHEATMRGLAFGTLALAGFLTLWPGRMMSGLVFGDWEKLGFTLSVAIIGLWGVARYFRRAVASRRLQ